MLKNLLLGIVGKDNLWLASIGTFDQTILAILWAVAINVDPGLHVRSVAFAWNQTHQTFLLCSGPESNRRPPSLGSTAELPEHVPSFRLSWHTVWPPTRRGMLYFGASPVCCPCVLSGLGLPSALDSHQDSRLDLVANRERSIVGVRSRLAATLSSLLLALSELLLFVFVWQRKGRPSGFAARPMC